MNENTKCAAATPRMQPMSIKERQKRLATRIENLDPARKKMVLAYLDFLLEKEAKDRKAKTNADHSR